MRLRSTLLRIMSAWLLLGACTLWAQDAFREALFRSSSAISALSQSSFGQRLVAADFDNDQKPDGALLVDAGVSEGRRTFRIEVHLSAGEYGNLTFASEDGILALAALDVNEDGIPDLIVEKAFTHERLQIWLNDGHGKFRQARAEDFPALSGPPFHWSARFAVQVSPELSLPTRFETYQALQLIEVLRFDSSSSRWRILPHLWDSDQSLVTPRSPRAPPVTLPL
jgi:hypothetical protein